MKVPFRAALIAVSLASVFRADEPGTDGSGEAAKAPAKILRKINMDDGRVVEFGEKTRMQKEYGIEDSNVFARIDFDNGKVVKVLANAGNLVELSRKDEAEGATAEDAEIANSAKVTLQLIGHGMVQKLGDAAAGAESTDDALEAVLEVASRIAKGQFNKVREGGGSAKGAGELVAAMHEYLAKDNAELSKDAVRDMLSKLSPQEKAGLRKVPEVAEIIEKLRAARKPSEAEQKKVAESAALLAALKEGKVPERKAEEPAIEGASA